MDRLASKVDHRRIGRWTTCVFLWAGQALATNDAVQPQEASKDGAPLAEYDLALDRGVAEYRKRHFREARAHFQRAHALAPTARTWRALGMTAFELERYTDAWSELRQALETNVRPLEPEQRMQIQELLEKTEQFVGIFEVAILPATATATLDGRPVDAALPLVLDVGTHALAVRADGYEPFELTVRVSGGERGPLTVELKSRVRTAVSAPPPSPDASRPRRMRPLEAGLMIGGGALLAGAAITGAMALSLDSKLADACPGGQCGPEHQDQMRRLEVLAPVTDALWITGGISLGVGAALWLFDRAKAPAKERVVAGASREGFWVGYHGNL